jgi:hypothetical protein
MATDVPLPTWLMFLLDEEAPSILTLGATPPVSKINPLGAFRIIVPVPTLPFASSV